MISAAHALGERLPPDVVTGGSLPWNRYRQYPVFGARWLAGRTLLFAGAVGAFALVTGLAVGFAARDYRTGLLVGLYSFVAFTTMATAGPAFATWVRHRRWRLRSERVAVVLALLLGVVASFFADRWASGFIEQHVDAAMGQAGRAAPPVRSTFVHPAPTVEPLQQRLRTASPFERAAALTVNVVVLLVVYGLFGGGLALRAYFTEQRRREASAYRRELEAANATRRDAEARLGVLQAQVEPHFLFNTLAAVRALVRDRPELAEQTLDALVGYLRASIPRLRDGTGLIDATLGNQLELCAHYLDVMRLRSGGRLTHAVDVDPALRAAPFPPLLLITLVENAVKHGIEPKPGPGHVRLQAGCHDGRLRVDVLDDGVGLAPGFGSGGLGLENVRAQLKARHGERAFFELRRRAEGGTLARLELPLEGP